MSCVCNDFPSGSIEVSLGSDPISLWSETINFSEKIGNTKIVNNVIEKTTKQVIREKNVCSDRNVERCTEVCREVCKCEKTLGVKVCGCKLVGIDRVCETSCKTVVETYCYVDKIIENVVEMTKLDVNTDFYAELNGTINIDLYAETSTTAGTGGLSASGSLYLVLQVSKIQANAGGSLKVKNNKVAGFSIKQGATSKPSKTAFQKFDIPPIIAVVKLEAGIDSEKLNEFDSIWDFLDSEISACVGFEQLNLDYNVGPTKFNLGNPAINICASPELRKIVFSLQGSIEHSFDRIKNTSVIPKISSGFVLPISVPLT